MQAFTSSLFNAAANALVAAWARQTPPHHSNVLLLQRCAAQVDAARESAQELLGSSDHVVRSDVHWRSVLCGGVWMP
jgi:hypothetical protein